MSYIRDIGESLGTTVIENVGRVMGRTQERTPLPVDLLESDDAYLAVFDAPGASSEAVQVQYDDGAIEVRIDRFRGFHEGFEMRYPGRGLSLDGRVELPQDARVDADAATASLGENGTLEVRVPKAETAADGPDVDTGVDTNADSDTDVTTGADTDADEWGANGDETGEDSGYDATE